ncbi:flagellar hook-associated protein 1 FlgK [Anaerovirgula multivorans]|uniref:Flagellar hook-associated protein 1 n=1 Tax=Anaerovirgula multivorans TaxID=312168 RepID=A0A239EY80_9FIRM|nr:flagellar hook-associated protein FlgK [Anaerovirgula multivorans]SNS49238.1 flagellar hook-associated protein 1 FlgK [Anaerovirgula multivorans]
MRSTFLGFNTATSGLFASQRALDITGHNLANVNTAGYTRQRLIQTQSTPMPLSGRQGMLGTGVDTVAIQQLRNEFLDYRYRGEVNSLGYWEAKSDGLYFLEAIMNEPSETGINTIIKEFFDSFQQLSKPENANSLATRRLVRENASAFTSSINSMYSQMENLVRGLNNDVVDAVNSINGYAEQIAQLNEQISRYEIGGSTANDLRDRRNLLIDELSKLVNIEVLEVSDGNGNNKMAIQINGNPLVHHDRVKKLDAGTKEKSEFFDEMGVDLEINVVRWADGTILNTSALKGELKGLLDLRDGQGGATKGVPYYIERLNHFAQVLAEEVNKLHSSGFGLNETTGIMFFTANGVSTEEALKDTSPKINAKNIAVALDLEDLNKIAAASELDLLPGDGSNALKLAELRNNGSMFKEGKAEDFMTALIANLGVDSLEAQRNAVNQFLLTEMVDTERQRISGVSTEEELTNMIRFQHAYNASARMVTTFDEMLDVIINKLGIVGR